MVNQICIAGLVQALSEGLNFAQKSGLDAAKVLEVVSGGAAGSWQMTNRWPTMAEGKFDFGFAVNWMRKDLAICLEERAEWGGPADHRHGRSALPPRPAEGRRALGHLLAHPEPARGELRRAGRARPAPSGPYHEGHAKSQPNRPYLAALASHPISPSTDRHVRPRARIPKRMPME
jgi:hypothetical protein